jgi:hypothetical protein
VKTQTNGFAELQWRIARLETQNRRFKRLGTVGLIVVACLVVIGQAAPSKKIAEANEFILRDDSGNIRARLFVTEKQTTKMTIPGSTDPVPVTFNPKPTLALYNEKGETAGIIDDNSLSFIKSHVSLSGGVLSIGDQTAAVVVSPYSVGLFDEEGYETTLGRRALATARTGETHLTSAASLVMFDKNKKVIWKAP